MSVFGKKVLLRLVTGLVALATVLSLIWVPGIQLGFSLFISGLAAIGLYEYYAIVRARKISPETIGGILAGTALAFSGHFHQPVLTNLFLFGGCLLVSTLHIVRGQHSVAGLSSTVFGVFYIGWLAAHITLLNSRPVIGAGLVTILLAVVAITDSGAYFVGSSIGRHKMAPKVSPGKTWEGAIGGFLCGILSILAVYMLKQEFHWTALPDWSLAAYLRTGALLAIICQIGDLAESCLKRDAGVKDSGNLFPGHGGVLDRCDGFLFAAPVLYYIVEPVLSKPL